MLGYLLRRGAQSIPVLLIGSIAVSILVRLIPGDPADALLGEDATPEDYQRIYEQLGLDQPWPEQYLSWMMSALTGDFGTSFRTGIEVRAILMDTLPPSIELAVAAYVIALVVGLPLGLLAGVRPRSLWDWGLSAYTIGTFGIPNFVLGIYALWLFAVLLGWFPVAGRVAFVDDPLQSVKHLVLPAVTLGSGVGAVLGRYTRTSVLEIMGQDYIRTARAKGLNERVVVYRHALRNALIPIVTIAALQIGNLVTGVVIIETVFTRPGLGRALVQGINFRDYPVIQGLFLFLVIVFVTVNLAADLLYGVVDPRLRAGRST